MNISEKLQILRKNKGFSQEELAEKLLVSRQAIGKWESGSAYPELDKLIQLSDLYKISLDRLVKDTGNCNIQISTHILFDESLIIAFLLRAKKASYAGHGEEIKASRRKSHDLEYTEGDFYYYDTYLGGERFTGEEAIWEKDSPIWGMNYCGRVIGEYFNSDFLKSALAEVPYEKPFRGPTLYQEGEYSYHCKADGNFTWYQGYEEILYKGMKIYECYFHGGSVW